MKKTGNSQIKNKLLLLMPCAAVLYASYAGLTLSALAQETMDGSMMGPDTATPVQVIAPTNQAHAALNVAPMPIRQAIPAPPETPQASSALFLQRNNRSTSTPQAWRVKALQLFKANSLDKSLITSMRIQSNYRNAFNAVRKTLKTQGLTIESSSSTSGHILVNSTNEKGTLDRAIIALKQSSSDQGDNCTDLRAYCDKYNRTLTTVQLKSVLAQLDATISDQNNKPDADAL